MTMRPRPSVRVIFLLVFGLTVGPFIPPWMVKANDSSATTNRMTLDFEHLRRDESLTSQFASTGISFEGAGLATQGAGLNFLEYPPRSGVNVIFDDWRYSSPGLVVVSFDPELLPNVQRVGAYITGEQQIIMTAYDSSGTTLATASTSGPNFAPNGTPNELLEVSTIGAIAKVTFFNESARGNTYAVDDLFIEAILDCQISGVPLYKQGNSVEWAHDPYGGSTSQPWYDSAGNLGTIADYGSTLVSAAMIVSYHAAQQGKSATTPRELNNWLREHKGYSGGSILWPKVAEFARHEKGIKLYYYEGWGPDEGVVNSYICHDTPIVLNIATAAYSGGHFLVATGVGAENTWNTNDPGGYGLSHLSHESHQGYRQYGSEPTDLTYLAVVVHSPFRDLDNETFTLVATDPAGRQLNYDGQTGLLTNDMLNSQYRAERIDSSTESEGFAQAFIFSTGTPLNGEYKVQLLSNHSGEYQVDVLGYDASGDSKSIRSTLRLFSGKKSRMRIGYSSTSASRIYVLIDGPVVYLPTVQSR